MPWQALLLFVVANSPLHIFNSFKVAFDQRLSSWVGSFTTTQAFFFKKKEVKCTDPWKASEGPGKIFSFSSACCFFWLQGTISRGINL